MKSDIDVHTYIGLDVSMSGAVGSAIAGRIDCATDIERNRYAGFCCRVVQGRRGKNDFDDHTRRTVCKAGEGEDLRRRSQSARGRLGGLAEHAG